MSSHDFVQHGRALVQEGQFQEAVKVCRLGLLAHPTALQGRLVLGSALIALRRYDEVLAEMRVALEIDEGNAWALALKGQALLHKGKASQAALVIDRARLFAPGEQYIEDLWSRAQSALGDEALGEFVSRQPSETRTKNYPAHDDLETDTGSEKITRPQAVIGFSEEDDSNSAELGDTTDAVDAIEHLGRPLAPESALVADAVTPNGDDGEEAAYTIEETSEQLGDSEETRVAGQPAGFGSDSDIDDNGDYFGNGPLARTDVHPRYELDGSTPWPGRHEDAAAQRDGGGRLFALSPRDAHGEAGQNRGGKSHDGTPPRHAMAREREQRAAIRAAELFAQSNDFVPTKTLEHFDDSLVPTGTQKASRSGDVEDSAMATALDQVPDQFRATPSLSSDPPIAPAPRFSSFSSDPFGHSETFDASAHAMSSMAPGQSAGPDGMAGMPEAVWAEQSGSSLSDSGPISVHPAEHFDPLDSFHGGDTLRRDGSYPWTDAASPAPPNDSVEAHFSPVAEHQPGRQDDPSQADSAARTRALPATQPDPVPVKADLASDGPFFFDDDDFDKLDPDRSDFDPDRTEESTVYFQRSPQRESGPPQSPGAVDSDDFDFDDEVMLSPQAMAGRRRAPARPGAAPPGHDPAARARPRHPDEPAALSPPVGARNSQERGPSLDDLFPEEESGVSKIALIEEVLQAADAREQPAAGPEPTSLPSSKKSDMRLIRAGLGLEPTGTGEVSMSRQPPPVPASARPLPPRPAQPMPHRLPSKMPQVRVRGRGQPDRHPVDRTGGAPKSRSRWVYALYLLMALVVVAGGVFAGLQIREIRLARQIRTAQRVAVSLAQDDTYNGYLRARAAYDDIVAVRANNETRAQLARMRAAIAAEFGEGQGDAKALVSELDGVEDVNTACARALLALADDDLATAEQWARTVAQDHPAEPLGPYLTGRVALLARRADDALVAFNEALALESRPANYVGLGYAHLARSSYSEAKAAFQRALDRVPGHPSAIIGQAEITVAAGTVTGESDKIAQQLQELIERESDEPTAPSPWQRARASLAMVRLAIARDDKGAIEVALARTRELRPRRDIRFTKAFIMTLLDIGDIGAARAEAKRAGELWPERIDLRYELARVSLADGDPGAVVAILDGDVGGDVKALATRGRAYLMIGDKRRARLDLEAAFAANPNGVEVVLGMVDLALAGGDFRTALERIQPFYSPDAPGPVQVAYAAALRASGVRKKAREILTRAVGRFKIGRAYLELARLEVDEGNFKKASARYAAAIARMPKDLAAQLEVARLAVETGSIADARAALDQMVVDYAQSFDVLLEAARVQILTGAHEQAKSTLDAAEKLPEGKARGRSHIERERGRLALKEWRTNDAIDRLNTAKKLNSRDVEANLLLVHAHYAADKDKALRAAVQDIPKRFPKDAPVRELAMGRRETYFDRMGEALGYYRKAQDKLQSQNATPRQRANAIYWIGRIHLFESRLDSAEKSLLSATKLDPGNAIAFYYLGRLYVDRSRLTKAVSALETSLELDDRGAIPDAWFDLGETYFKLGRSQQAKKAFQKYLELWPKGDYTEDTREYLRKLR
ncbi:MAG: tetratricopeptide repeat protein [Proteobacteria bacterium]|nr:tetratricopeptide repeat protein [Pseudomonadota bacterium]